MGANLGAVIAGLINNGQSLPTVDIQNLLNTIQQNQQGNNQIINQLPANMQALYSQYAGALGGAGNTLQNTTQGIGQNLLSSTQNLYGPNNPAVQATLAALKQNDYSTLPGTLTNLKANLAATGGLNRGGAANAITKATLAPATQFSGQAGTVQGQQLQAQQQNVQQALNKIASLDDQTAQSLFGMSKEQATQILTGGRQDLQMQLSDLINSNNLATSQTLGAQGLADQNAYQNAVTRNSQQAAVVNGLTNLGVDAFAGGFGGGGASSGAMTFNPLTMSTPTGDNANPANYGIGQ